MLTRSALLPEYRAFLASIDPNVYPTFNFGYPVSIEAGQGSLVRFFNRLQRGVQPSRAPTQLFQAPKYSER
jgi:hypothetical protein